MGEWTLWVFTKNSDDGTIKTYVNGELWNSASGKNTQLAPITSFNIGSGYSSGWYLGTVDEFKIYDHELSVSEIAMLYDPDTVVASIDASKTFGEAPMEVVFDAAESFSGNGIVSYDWDFGDGNVASGVLATNTYLVDGSYACLLTVVDGVGVTNSANQTITVNSPVYSSNVTTMVYVANNWEQSNIPSVATNDLAQTAFLSSSSSNGNASSTIENGYQSRFFDGEVAESDIRLYVGDSFTIEFDTTDAPLGYDISEITSIYGASTSSGGRANQGYDIIVSYVDDSTETIASWKYWNPNTPDTTFWTGVTHTEESAGSFISGVKAITFLVTQAANPGGWLYGTEIDIFGTPTEITEAPVISCSVISDSLVLSWDSIGGARYGVQSAGNLTGLWNDDVTNIVATPPINVHTAAVDSASAEFFRVIVE
jgi:hypothetical protein